MIDSVQLFNSSSSQEQEFEPLSNGTTRVRNTDEHQAWQQTGGRSWKPELFQENWGLNRDGVLGFPSGFSQ
jgi:hypothetical protein